jgi:hypothetical protein
MSIGLIIILLMVGVIYYFFNKKTSTKLIERFAVITLEQVNAAEQDAINAENAATDAEKISDNLSNNTDNNDTSAQEDIDASIAEAARLRTIADEKRATADQLRLDYNIQQGADVQQSPTIGSSSSSEMILGTELPSSPEMLSVRPSSSSEPPIFEMPPNRLGSSSSSSQLPKLGSSSSSSQLPKLGSSSSSFQPTTMGSSSSSGSYNPVVDRPATVNELNEFKLKIQAEINRLSFSGALDTITQQRIRSLEKIKQYVQQIIDEVAAKQLAENKIPIMKSSIDAAFKALSSNTQLPDVFSDSQINNYLKGILPDNLAEDPEIARTIADYVRSFTQNLSWNFGVKYVSDAERDLATAYNNRANQESDDLTNSNLSMAGSAAGHLPDGYSNNAKTSDEFANTPHEACRGPSTFDWKKRSEEICRAIKSRGLDTKDYGCMPENVDVGPAFSFKGYSRMICTRVAANYDTGLGSLVGCPPLDWPGWRLK